MLGCFSHQDQDGHLSARVTDIQQEIAGQRSFADGGLAVGERVEAVHAAAGKIADHFVTPDADAQAACQAIVNGLDAYRKANLRDLPEIDAGKLGNHDADAYLLTKKADADNLEGLCTAADTYYANRVGDVASNYKIAMQRLDATIAGDRGRHWNQRCSFVC